MNRRNRLISQSLDIGLVNNIKPKQNSKQRQGKFVPDYISFLKPLEHKPSAKYLKKQARKLSKPRKLYKLPIPMPNNKNQILGLGIKQYPTHPSMRYLNDSEDA